MKFKYKVIFLCTLFYPQLVCSENQSFYDGREEGWYWYEETTIKPEPEDEKKNIPATKENNININLSTPEKTVPAEDIIKQQAKAFKSALQNVTIYPTPENAKKYLAITTQLTSQAEFAAKTIKEATWVSPEYDYALTGRPNNPQAIAAYNEKITKESFEKLYSIAKKKGILYFLRSDCPYCARFSPVLKKFAAQFGFTVIPVSLDNKGTPVYPYPKKSNYMAKRLNVTTVPATFLVDPDENSVSTISFGFTDWTTYMAKVLFSNTQLTAIGR